jgi:cytochrome c-type biogenesis protein
MTSDSDEPASPMTVMGIAMVTGTMTTFSFWLLQNMPMLARIG